jgi:hypothetical protein
MSAQPDNGILVGKWTYRSFLNDPDLSTQFNDLEFGLGTIEVLPSAMNEFRGTIGGPDWQLQLKGSTTYGNPFTVRFQGKGVVSGEEWIYDYIGYVIRPWPNGVDQRMAMVGSIVRTIPHSSGSGGTAPAGVVCSWIAVRQDEPNS